MQNARVEVIDPSFFWISLAQRVGLDVQDVVDLYMQLPKVNQDRRDADYSMAGKSGEGNRCITLSREDASGVEGPCQG